MTPGPSGGSTIRLVLGGARSGKSVEAERIIGLLADGGPVTYVATARLPESGPDASLAERVAAHRARRPAHWRTVEAGDDLPALLRGISGPVLLDALGPWIASRWPSTPDPAPLVAALCSRDGATVVVGDEVGLSVHPETEAGRWFVDAMGAANQAIASVADDVRLVVAGRVLVLPPPDDSPSR